MNKYKLCTLNEYRNINVDKIKQTMRNNKTFEVFMNICCQYDICLFNETPDGWVVKENNILIEECKLVKQNVYQESINKLHTLMRTDTEWVDSKMRIDKISQDLKRNIKNLDMAISLLRNVYSEKSLSNITKKTDKKRELVLIEEYSN